MSNSFSTFQIKTESSILGISEQGGYVTEWKVKNLAGEWTDILYIGTELKRTGIPILFPYYGPSDSGTGQHGFGRNLKWYIVSRTETEAKLEITDADLDPATKLLYPHQFKTTLTLKLLPDSFEYTLDVENTGTAPLPIAPGLHPYWAVDHTNKSQVTIENYPEIDLTKIDWDTNPPDKEYAFRNPVTINFPDERNSTSYRKVTIEDQSDKISKLVVWSQPRSAPDHDFICFEPVTLERRSFDSTPLVVQGQSNFQMTIKFSVQLA